MYDTFKAHEELAKWKQFGCTRRVTWPEWEEAVRQKVNVVGTRWVPTRKNLGWHILAHKEQVHIHVRSADNVADDPSRGVELRLPRKVPRWLRRLVAAEAMKISGHRHIPHRQKICGELFSGRGGLSWA